MKTINLRWIYPHYRHDEFVEVSDEVLGGHAAGPARDEQL